MRTEEKIFGIGLGKTGTSSLCQAMHILGYKAKHAPKFLWEVDQYDFLNDVFITWRYKFFDEVFSNAKFILTYRELESWIGSCEKYAKKKSARGPLRRLEGRFYSYGCLHYDEEKFRKAHAEFNKEVMDHFGDRSDFMVMNVCEGEGWEKLCSFLGKPIPDVEFPHRNKGNK